MIQWVFDGKLFTKLTGDDDISSMLAYADGNITLLDDASSYQLKELANNRGAFSRSARVLVFVCFGFSF